MYNNHFGFTESPFENNLDQSFLFLSEDHKEVLAALLYFIKENKAFAILCGDVGTGKTMILNSFVDGLPASYHPIVISNPSVEYREILDYVAQTLGIDVTGRNVLEVIDEVKKALTAAQKEKKYYFLVIDEAHLLSDRSLDDIRLLSNIESRDRKLLQILLVGQYELSYKLQRPQMRQLRQRISINRFLSSLDFDETSRYIDHRLKLVGSSFKACFEANCLPLIYKLTDGVPRQINHVCDNALLVCKADERKKVNKKIVIKTDKALRSDLIFTPKSFQLRSKSAVGLRKWIKPVTVASAGMVIFFVILFLSYTNFFSKTGKHGVSQQFRQTASLPDGLSDRKQEQDIINKETTSIDRGLKSGQPQAQPDPGAQEKYYASLIEPLNKPSGLSSQGPASPLDDSDTQEAMSPDSETTVPIYLDHDRVDEQHDLSLPSPKKVVVRDGDTLLAIAYKHYSKDIKSAIEAILSANPEINNKNLIYSGQVLDLPAMEAHYRPLSESMKERTTEFTIQVCTLLHTSEAVAEDFALQLKQRGYPVYITEILTKQGNRMFKICIGRYTTEGEAIEAALYFQKKEGKPGVVIKLEVDTSTPLKQDKP